MSSRTNLDRYLAEAVREIEAHPIASTCHVCGGNGVDRERDVDGGPLPCHWCGGNGLEYETLVVEGQVTG